MTKGNTNNYFGLVCKGSGLYPNFLKNDNKLHQPDLNCRGTGWPALHPEWGSVWLQHNKLITLTLSNPVAGQMELLGSVPPKRWHKSLKTGGRWKGFRICPECQILVLPPSRAQFSHWLVEGTSASVSSPLDCSLILKHTGVLVP